MKNSKISELTSKRERLIVAILVLILSVCTCAYLFNFTGADSTGRLKVMYASDSYKSARNLLGYDIDEYDDTEVYIPNGSTPWLHDYATTTVDNAKASGEGDESDGDESIDSTSESTQDEVTSITRTERTLSGKTSSLDKCKETVNNAEKYGGYVAYYNLINDSSLTACVVVETESLNKFISDLSTGIDALTKDTIENENISSNIIKYEAKVNELEAELEEISKSGTNYEKSVAESKLTTAKNILSSYERAQDYTIVSMDFYTPLGGGNDPNATTLSTAERVFVAICFFAATALLFLLFGLAYVCIKWAFSPLIVRKDRPDAQESQQAAVEEVQTAQTVETKNE